MSLNLQTILPNIGQSLHGTGFFFGAGTSREAGYPMMPALTRQVLSKLSPDERATLNHVLKSSHVIYDEEHASPNIEVLSDLIIEHRINSNDPKCYLLEERIRSLIVEEILSVQSPNLDHHCRFLEGLRRRAFGLPCTVWIFTTNYDLLFETAAARVGVAIENGFSGVTERFFNPGQFKGVSGEITGNRFTPNNQLTIKLVKLHGSVSWAKQNSYLYERDPIALSAVDTRLMVLPRRKKIVDTLTSPYDVLFAYASRVIGAECKYLVSCGFSFGDDHINLHLLDSPLRSNRCRLFVLCEHETDGISNFKSLPNFAAGLSTHTHLTGVPSGQGTGTDLWKFSNFANLF